MTSTPRLTRTLATAFAALLLLAGSLTAQGKEAFTEARFEALQAEGALVLVNCARRLVPDLQSAAGGPVCVS